MPREQDEINSLKQEIHKLEAEVTRLRKAANWQPMSTAPRDGTYILAISIDCSLPDIVFFSKESEWFEELQGNALDYLIGWMPLPTNPDARY